MRVPPATADVIRRWHAACNKHDADAAVGLAHEAIEIRPDPEPLFVPSGTRYHGVDGVRSLIAHVRHNFPRIHTEVHDLRAAGAWTVVAVTSTPDLDDPATSIERTLLYAVEDGQIRCVRACASEADALEVAHGSEVSVRRVRSLTERERQVLQLLAAGLKAPEIADRLVLSPATVRTHVQNAMGRLGARTRVHAIVIALANGEIAPRG